MGVKVAEDWEGAVDPFCKDEGVGVPGCVDAGFSQGKKGL